MQMNKQPLYRNYSGMPSQQQQQRHNNKGPSKVVTIPVQFVGSERSRNDSAIKIQKVVRGFILRSTMKRIMGIRVEVEEVEAKVYESLEVIKRDQKERVRVSETIMNLLLKLDSVRVLSYCYGVRECRKSVIKKAIALQEMVDQMVGSNDNQGEEQQPHHGDEDESEESGCAGESQGEGMETGVGTSLAAEEENCLVKEESGCVGDSQGEKMEEESNDLVKEGASEMLVAESQDEKMDGLRNEENEEEEVKMEVVEEREEGEGECVGEENVGTSLVEENNCVVKEEEEEEEEEEHDDDERGVEDGWVRKEGSHREMLERMMEDNEKMMAMMAQLCEKNEMQTRLLTSLSRRVEQLERAFACEMLRRCKRRNADSKQQKQSQPKKGSI